MAITEIIRFGSTNPQDSVSLDQDAVREAIEALQESRRARHESLGIEVKNPTAAQVTTEWDDDHQVHPGTSPITDSLKEYLGKPRSIFHVALNQPALGPDGAATSNVVEFAANYFPVSRLTSDYINKIHEDFLRFDRICKPGLKGSGELSYGWVDEEQDHPDVKGDKVKCFLIIRGWESFEHFQRATQSEAVKEALPILFAWQASYEMWHIERKS